MRKRFTPSVEVVARFVALFPLSISVFYTVQIARMVIRGGAWPPPSDDSGILTLDLLQALGLLVALTALLIAVAVRVTSKWKTITDTYSKGLRAENDGTNIVQQVRAGMGQSDTKWKELKDRVETIRASLEAIRVGEPGEHFAQEDRSSETSVKRRRSVLVRTILNWVWSSADYLANKAPNWMAWSFMMYVLVYFVLRWRWMREHAFDIPEGVGASVVLVNVDAAIIGMVAWCMLIVAIVERAVAVGMGFQSLADDALNRAEHRKTQVVEISAEVKEFIEKDDYTLQEIVSELDEVQRELNTFRSTDTH